MVRCVILAVVALLPTVCQAQLFPRLFGGKSTAQVGSACPGGVCPTAQSSYGYPVASAVIQPLRSAAGHWSYPGSIDSHLESTHGVATAGMSRQQKLDLHDSLHEGTASKARYPSVSSAVGYGSSGSVVGGGSTGSLVVGSRLSDGSIVTSVGVTVAQVRSSGVCDCCCPDCKCSRPAEVPSVESRELRAPVGSIENGIGDRVAFRRSLLAAARQAREKGTITTMEFFLVSAASRNPVALDRMMGAVHEAAIEDGKASVNAVNWDAIAKFIETLIPLLIKILPLFIH